jgi:hypothetical protein
MKLFNACVYTIVDADRLIKSDRGKLPSLPISEKRSWRAVEQWLVEANARDEQVALVLADAKQVHRWLGWATLRDVAITKTEQGGFQTDYRFENLRPFSGHKRSEFRLLKGKGPLSDLHIRPYVLFETPDFLRQLANDEEGALLSQWLQQREAVAQVFDVIQRNDEELHRDTQEVLARGISAAREIAPEKYRVVLTPERIRLVVGQTEVMSFGEECWFFPDREPDDTDNNLSFKALFDKYEGHFRQYLSRLSAEPVSDLPNSEAVVIAFLAEKRPYPFRSTDATDGEIRPIQADLTLPGDSQDRSDAVGKQSDTEEEPGPLNSLDARERVQTDVTRRQGQPKFRRALLDAYRGQCAISGWAVTQVLEAAHILPYRGAHSNPVSNGVLLRSDLHMLFDQGLIDIDPETYKVAIAPDLMGTPYEEFSGKRIQLPADRSSWPDSSCIRKRAEMKLKER